MQTTRNGTTIRKEHDLLVITRLRDATRYLFQITAKAPQRYRHSFVEKLQKTLEGIKKIAEGELKLQFNEKTQITPLKNGIDFLGWHFYLTDTGKVIRKLRQTAKKRIFARLKKLQKDYAENKTDIETTDQSMAAIRGRLKHGNTDKLLMEILKRFVLRRENKTQNNAEKR